MIYDKEKTLEYNIHHIIDKWSVENEFNITDTYHAILNVLREHQLSISVMTENRIDLFESWFLEVIDYIFYKDKEGRKSRLDDTEELFCDYIRQKYEPVFYNIPSDNMWSWAWWHDNNDLPDIQSEFYEDNPKLSLETISEEWIQFQRNEKLKDLGI